MPSTVPSRMVKTAAFYLVPIKSYSKNTHPPFFFETGNNTWGYYLRKIVNTSVFILLYESYMIMKDHMLGSYMDLIVCLDIRYQRLRFFVRFFIWSGMIRSDIGVRSRIIVSESVIDLIVRFLDLGSFDRPKTIFELGSDRVRSGLAMLGSGLAVLGSGRVESSFAQLESGRV
jgi:hypothetical protein